MRTIEVLTKARALIADPSNWIKGALTDQNGAYCARGALVQVTNSYDTAKWTPSLVEAMTPAQKEKAYDYLYSRVEQAVPFVPCQLVAGLNNSSTHEEVLSMFDMAIARQLVIDSMAEDSLVETIVNAPVYLEDIMQRADKTALLVGV